MARAPTPPAGGASPACLPPPSPLSDAGPSRHARLDRAVFGLSIVSTIITLPGFVPSGAIMTEAWAYLVANCVLVVASTLWAGAWGGWRRDAVVATHRVASALFGQRVVGAGRLLPMPVNSWAEFFGVSWRLYGERNEVVEVDDPPFPNLSLHTHTHTRAAPSSSSWACTPPACAWLTPPAWRPPRWRPQRACC